MINKKTMLVRIDMDLYKEIKREKELLEYELGRPVSFSKASRVWFNRIKEKQDFRIIRF